MFKKSIKLSSFILIISTLNLFLFHLPVYRFSVENYDGENLDKVLLILSLAVLILALNALVFYLVLFISRSIGKFFLVLFTNINAIAVYFINTYNVIIDKTMIGNVLNTNFDESTSFLSFGFVLYLVLLGIIPSILIIKTKIIKEGYKKTLKHILLTFIFIAGLAYVNSSNWLWIDKNSKALGGLAMPWSYVVNLNRFYYHKSQENQEQILLPDATLKDDEKSVVVLVIGESARSQNFSLYGYEKETNPLLTKMNKVYSYKANSCATYTTAGVKCILEHENSSKLNEILPNYLFRNNVEVIWRTNNWGEPNVRIKNYQKKVDLKKQCLGEGCEYDEILLNNLEEQIQASKKNKILIILHTSTSHGPTYYKKYPPKFNKFKPVCKVVELGKCTQEELINAYNNTIVYTDYILATLINNLKQLVEYNSLMIYVSDHGESLGEKNLYMHGIPKSIAPKEQLDIPFIVWQSNDFKKLKKNEFLSQHHVFHSVLDFLAIESPIYNKNMSIFIE
ncbi:phosphoethanolamine--lipid A transferase EptA [Flavobacteriaceae bacterium]|nr:phosphoethanolamine--lipid A transferase EptA [Flavobacteriaceae bacterium]